jgi:hypothetical protein
VEQLAFVEIDRATEGSAAIARKLEVYRAYWASGAEQAQRGVFPKVVWLGTTERRARQLREQFGRQPAGAPAPFTATVFEDALAELTGAADGSSVAGGRS